MTYMHDIEAQALREKLKRTEDENRALRSINIELERVIEVFRRRGFDPTFKDSDPTERVYGQELPKLGSCL